MCEAEYGGEDVSREGEDKKEKELDLFKLEEVEREEGNEGEGGEADKGGVGRQMKSQIVD